MAQPYNVYNKVQDFCKMSVYLYFTFSGSFSMDQFGKVLVV